MHFPKSATFSSEVISEKIMGPNPLKLIEELFSRVEPDMTPGSLVLDLGSGTGITSALLAREYGFTVLAADLWSNPGDNLRFFEALGIDRMSCIPLKADAENLPFAEEFFDAVVSVDSYNYFGRDADYLGEKLLPFLKPGGTIYLVIPGMVKDCHDNLPPELLLSWTPEQLDYMHDMSWWRALLGKTAGVEIEAMLELESNDEAWADWLACENEYAQGDRASMEAGAGKYLNSLGIVLRKHA